ncbi:bifunctional alpha/beta hydrolase/OsmC family protein [Paeniglutamicibacter antarcticus]|uniref:Bifunctional alpha/beta hydrolase/OsmC family protein n=2 Tax=Paeniglutamicibacter antarcticus TaxID=494023 RepID=A0ABP9TF31_9MICC
MEFPGSQGDALAARLDLPDGEVRAYALFAHCFSCSKDVFAASRVSKALTASGIAVLRFDFTGLGQSDGDFSNTNFSSNIDDLVSAADFLRKNYQAPRILIGHSLGGSAVLAAAHRIASVRAVATIAAPADPLHVKELLRESVETIREQGFAEVQLGGRRFNIQEQFLADAAAQPQAERIRTLGAALLVMHSPVDQIVSVDEAGKIFSLARHPKSFVALDGADHLLSRREDSQFAADIIGAWAGRYAFEENQAPSVGGAAPTRNEAQDASVVREPGIVTVQESGNGSFQQLISSGHHAVLADEPTPIGTDTGLSPYELLLAGLGACTSMTLRMYAQRKKLDLQKVSVRLAHSRIHAEDCANCETTSGKIDHIERSITLTGNLSDEQRNRMLEIADKCPVHRTLESEISITSTLA